jgi:hypothetical protein
MNPFPRSLNISLISQKGSAENESECLDQDKLRDKMGISNHVSKVLHLPFFSFDSLVPIEWNQHALEAAKSHIGMKCAPVLICGCVPYSFVVNVGRYNSLSKDAPLVCPFDARQSEQRGSPSPFS